MPQTVSLGSRYDGNLFNGRPISPCPDRGRNRNGCADWAHFSLSKLQCAYIRMLVNFQIFQKEGRGFRVLYR